MTATLVAPADQAFAGPGVRADRLAGGPDWLLGRLPDLGPLQLRAANADVALSLETALAAPRRCGAARVLPAAGAELRMDPEGLGTVFALADGPAGRRREGLRILDRDGEVALSADLTHRSDRGAFRMLTADGVSPPRPLPVGGVSPNGHARDGVRVAPVEPSLVSELLETLADAAVPLRLVLPGTGLVMAVTTLIGNPVRHGGGIHLHGAGVRAEIAGSGVAAAELRRVAVDDGYAHALDLVGRGGERALRLMGQPVDGRPEDGAWRTLMTGLAPLEVAG